MNTQSNAMPESFDPHGIPPAPTSTTRPLYWSIRRELWENRSIYIGPLVAAVLFLFGFVINLLSMRRSIGASPLDPAQPHDLLATRYELSGALIMGTALIVGVFYSLDALYGERRDRSILFWKSLPVSDLTTVLSKLTIPLVILPLLSFAITLATQFIMLLLSSVILLGSGVNIAALWTEVSFFRVSVVLLYHLFTVHGLWYAPLYGWLLLVSAWAPRAPFIWAFLPPFVISIVERIAFNTSHFAGMLENRFSGGGAEALTMPGTFPMNPMTHLTPGTYLSSSGLWIGGIFTAVCIAAAVRLRRYRGPI